ncbi:hypothetical protein GCM10010916_39380 [Paenibacillus abyssi]|uniref:Uncharacterized protein n=1 Tax=Paenibacillus abyssi TaxID=1340531 RepID=A0A917LFN8_9BACL|nr:hypothetical protein GCM10010916_39380 [Paenibacillus abyssi]
MNVICMNIDRPNQKCTVHESSSCKYAAKRSETLFKGINELKRDGGWLDFRDLASAKAYHKQNFEHYEWCKHC